MQSLKKELLNKAVKYNLMVNAALNDRAKLSEIRESMLKDMLGSIYLLVSADSEGGKTFYKDLSEGPYSRYGIDSSKAKVNWERVKSDIRKHYRALFLSSDS